ncbi:MAG: TetR/AcrR family transcriptional regulator [Myxococcota bacterium]|nr:TetR/AcrR family transcriptional regulator [Myxococcota bacterium]
MYRTLVLRCAEQVFAERGYHTAKMQEVAAAAGISLATLYATFPSKQQVFETLHEMRGAEFLAHVDAALAEPGDARASLRRGVRAFVDYLANHADYFRMDLREGRSWAIGDVESSPAFQAGIEHWTQLMKRGIAEGTFSDEDPGVMAVTAFGVMQIQLAAWLAKPGEPDAAAIAERICRHLERAFCAGGAASGR